MTIRSGSVVLQRPALLAMLGVAFLFHGCCDPRIVTAFIPDGCVDQYYVLVLEGACADDRWTVTSGDLPPGIALSISGLLSGTPTLAGTFLFTVTLSSEFDPTSKGFSMTIHEADSPECLEDVEDNEDLDGGVNNS